MDATDPARWVARAPAPPLGAGDLHVWRIDVRGPPAAADRELLSPDELARADRFVFARDRDRFVAAHAGLRRVLAGYLGCPPRALGFDHGPRGKPGLTGAGAADEAPLEFNLSHARDLALVAVTRGRAVGVDVEWHRPDVEIDLLAAQSFSPGERRALAALPPEQRRAGFFRCWTRKESYIKAHGLGLAMALDRFTVSIDDVADDTGAIGLIGDDPDAAGRWSIRALPVAAGGWPDYSAAVAVAGPSPAPSLWELAPAGASSTRPSG